MAAAAVSALATWPNCSLFTAYRLPHAQTPAGRHTALKKKPPLISESHSPALLAFRRRESRLLKASVPMQNRDLLIGYARVSTDDQDLRLQRAVLKEAGWVGVDPVPIRREWRQRPVVIEEQHPPPLGW